MNNKQIIFVSIFLFYTSLIFSQQWTENSGTAIFTSSPVGIKNGGIVLDDLQIGNNAGNGGDVSFRLNSGNAANSIFKFRESSGDYGFDFLYNGFKNKLFLNSNNSGTIINCLTVDRNTGRVGIKTDEMVDDFQIGKNTGNGSDVSFRLNSGNSGNSVFKFRESSDNYGFDFLYNGSQNKLFLYSNIAGNQTSCLTVMRDSGQVGIGTDTVNPEYKFAVNGKIGAKEIEVSLDHWADYVFNDNYKLLPLMQLDRFIKQNKHLPEVPSTETVMKEGVNLGEMNVLLLKKIEELTLYMIELKKENEELKKYVHSKLEGLNSNNK